MSKIDYHLGSFFISCIPLWNGLPEDYKSKTASVIQKQTNIF